MKKFKTTKKKTVMKLLQIVGMAKTKVNQDHHRIYDLFPFGLPRWFHRN